MEDQAGVNCDGLAPAVKSPPFGRYGNCPYEFVIPGRERSSRARNPIHATRRIARRVQRDALSLWIPGSRLRAPGIDDEWWRTRWFRSTSRRVKIRSLSIRV